MRGEGGGVKGEGLLLESFGREPIALQRKNKS